MKNILKGATLMIVLSSSVIMANAQAGNNTVNRGISSATNNPTDTAFIGKNLRDNMMEIALLQIAIKQGVQPQIRKAASQMLVDHRQIHNDLARLARKYNLDVAAMQPSRSTEIGGESHNYHLPGTPREAKPVTADTLGRVIHTTEENRSTPTNTNDSIRLRTIMIDAFDRNFVVHMLAMHEAKLTELNASLPTVRDKELRAAVTKAIPKIRMHRAMLSKMNAGNPPASTNQQ